MIFQTKKPPVPPAFVLLGGILAVSTASLFIRYAQQEAPSIVIAAWRLGIASLVLAPLAWMRCSSEIRSLNLRQIGLLVLSGVLLALHFASWITSLEYTTVASSVVLVTTTPLWVGLLSPLILRERLTRFVQIGLLVAMVGGIIVGLSEACDFTGRFICEPIDVTLQSRALTGNGLALIGAFCAAGYLLVGRWLRSSLSLLAYITMVYGTAAVVLLLGVFLSGSTLIGYPSQTYLWFAALAFIPQLLGHSSFNWSLKYLPAAFVSVTLLAEPVGSILLAFMFLTETPGILELAGGILILAGIYISSRSAPVGEIKK
jgi:drug/metabolite transporter (DMT)-like permease